jgi:hypothetical protein
MFYTAKSEAVPVAHENTKNLQAFTIEQIERMRAGDEKFVPIFLILFDWYKKNV